MSENRIGKRPWDGESHRQHGDDVGVGKTAGSSRTAPNEFSGNRKNALSSAFVGRSLFANVLIDMV